VKLIDTPSNNKNLSFEVTFNKMPDVDIKEIKNIKINLPEVVIEQTDIDLVISNIQKQNTVWVDSNMISKSGDKLVVDYEGNINGNEFKNNKQADFTFVINDTIKGDSATVELFNQFSKECLGKKINDTVVVSNNMPKDFPDKELAGKLVKYDVKIKKILEGTLPELNKDFFGLLGIDTDDVVEFRENVKKHMEFELKDKMVSKKYGLVNEQLVSYFNFTPPEAMVSKHQLELEQQYSALKKSDENIDEKIKEIAIKRVKLNILYIKLAKEVTTNITDQEAIDFSNEQSPSFRQFYSEKLKKDKDSTLMDIKNKIVENAIVEYVIDTASITPIKKTFAEAMDE
jgi:trigger factor